MQKRTLKWIYAAILIFSLMGPTAGTAGDGKFHDPSWDGNSLKERGTIDVNVLLDENNSLSDTELEQYFNNISEDLYDATEKQVQLGVVKIYRGGPQGKDKADLLISDQIDRAYTYAGNFGDKGSTARIYLNDQDLSESRPVVVHEMGHLIFNILDSYTGYLSDSSSPSDKNQKYLAPNASKDNFEWRSSPYYYDYGTVPSPDTNDTFYDTTPFFVSSIACIMDGPWSGETEFSTPEGNGWVTDHIAPFQKDISWNTALDGTHLSKAFEADDVWVMTKQNAERNNQSAWETINDFRSAMRIPQSEPVSDKSGHEPIDFRMIPAVNEFSVCMDRSGSMAGSPLELAKKSTNIVVGLSHEGYEIQDPWKNRKITIPGDYLSITDFNSTSRITFSDGGSVAAMTSVNKSIAKSAISSIGAGGSTSIGSGLIRSRDTFTPSADAPQSIILLSDGQENTSPYVSQMKQTLIDRNIKVYSVGLGSGADQAMLRKIADETGGKFFYASKASQLPGIFATLYGEIRNDGLLKIIGGIFSFFSNVSSGSSLAPKSSAVPFSNQHTESVLVDDSVGEATFLVTWDNGSGEVYLIDPGGFEINPGTISNFPDVEYSNGEGYAIYRVKKAKSGYWDACFTSDSLNDVNWQMQVFAVDNDVYFEADAEKGTYIYPEPIVLKANCAAPQPIIGGQAFAEVIRPDGTVVEVELFDDGNMDHHGDEYANDGIYSTIFRTFSIDGVYTVTAGFDSEGGYTPSPSETQGIEFSIPRPGSQSAGHRTVDKFLRYRQFTFSISGVPDIVPASVNLHPETLNLKSKGKYITAYLELSEPYNVNEIDTATIALKDNGSLICNAEIKPMSVGDFDLDGNEDLMVKFDRQSVNNYLKQNDKTSGDIEFSIECGLTGGEHVSGKKEIRVINPGKQK